MASIYQDYTATLKDYLDAGIPLADAQVYFDAGLAVYNGAIQGFQAGSDARQVVNYYVVNTGLVTRDKADPLELSASYKWPGVSGLVPKGFKPWWVVHRKSGFAPTWQECFDVWAATERARLAAIGWGLSASVPIDRAWVSDVDSQRVKHEIDTSYLLSLDEFNAATGANIHPYLPVLGVNAQTTPFVANGSLDPRPKGGWLEQNSGTILTLAAIAAGGYALATMGTAGATTAATAATAETAASSTLAATIYDPITAMTGAGVGVSDAVVAATAASAPGVASAGAALAEMQGAQWGALITGNVTAPVTTVAELAAKVPTQTQDLFTAQPAAQPAQQVVQLTGGNMGSIFDNISGTISDIGSTVSSAYGTVLDTQLKMTQLDILKAQAKAGMAPQVSTGMVSSGGMGIGMIAMIALALGGILLYMRGA